MKIAKLFSILPIATLFLFSCSNDSDNANLDLTELNAVDAGHILTTNIVTSSVDAIIAEASLASLPSGSVASKRQNNCYTTESTSTGYTLTFNNCEGGVFQNINGSVTIAYSFNNSFNITYTATYNNLSVDEYTISGTRRYIIEIDITDLESVELTSSTYTINIESDMLVETEDGTTIRETGNKTFTTAFDAESELSSLIISGTWKVIVNDNTFSIGGNLVSPEGCEFWSTGTLDIDKNGLEAAIDFGDGECDNVATIINPNNVSQDFTY